MPTRVNPPTAPERGPCEQPVREEPQHMPQENPVPVKFPDPIPVPNWPMPVTIPERVGSHA